MKKICIIIGISVISLFAIAMPILTTLAWVYKIDMFFGTLITGVTIMEYVVIWCYLYELEGKENERRT